jgi:hypothetical protein
LPRSQPIEAADRAPPIDLRCSVSPQLRRGQDLT